MQLSPTSSPLTRSHDDRSHDDGERGQSTERRIKALIVAPAFPDDVVELRASANNARAYVLRGEKRFPADLCGLADAGGDVPALRLARRAQARAVKAPLDAGSANLQRRLINPSASRRPRRPPKERSVNFPRCFGGRELTEFFM
jgi:hypothetical protein